MRNACADGPRPYAERVTDGDIIIIYIARSTQSPHPRGMVSMRPCLL